MLKNINLKSEFLKSVVLLTSGTVLAQLIHFGFQPIVARLFETSEIGELNYYLRIIAFIVSIGTLRYELSIPLPKKDAHAFQIVRIALTIAFFVFLLFIIGSVVYALFTDNFPITVLYNMIIGLIIFFSVFRNVGLNYAIRKKWFRSISYSKTIGALGMSLSKVGAGLLSMGSFGLLLATLLGVIAGTVVYLKQFFSENKLEVNQSSAPKQRALLKEHKDFPRLNLPHTLIDTGREVLIAILFVAYFGKDVFGSFSFGLMIMSLPLALIGTTIGQAFFQKASEMYNNKLPLYTMLRKTTLILTALSIIPFLILFLYGDDLFAWVFGEKWRHAGQIVEVLTPWIALKFVSSPISTIPLIIKKQKLFFWLGLINSLLQLGILYFLPLKFGFSSQSVLTVIQILSFTLSAYLIVVIFIKLICVKASDKLI
ncbi:MAG: lipopolysaccharide biosynthesis protein [Lishizhenia sp.]